MHAAVAGHVALARFLQHLGFAIFPFDPHARSFDEEQLPHLFFECANFFTSHYKKVRQDRLHSKWAIPFEDGTSGGAPLLFSERLIRGQRRFS